MSDETSARSGRALPPPLAYLAAIVLGVGLDLAVPLPVLPMGAALGTGVVASAAALALMVWAMRTMRAAGESPRPDDPTSMVVTGGPYRFSRNPIYVAFTLFAAGVALLVNSGWGLAFAALAAIAVHFAAVLSEERYLRARLGDEYARYSGRVRRWL